VTFSNAVTTSPGGTTKGVKDSDVIELESSSGTILSSVRVSDTEVIVKYC
jgi:hypothetical protein